MAWSPQQDAALIRIDRWLHDPSQQIFRLFGYAGTGKTTLAKAIAEGVDGVVLFAAFTGKAAFVLRTKGCPAQTIHSLIYNSKDKGKKRLREIEEQIEGLIAALQADGFNQIRIDTDKKLINLRKLHKEEEEALKRPFFALNPDSDLRRAKLLIVDEVSMVDEQIGKDLVSFGVKILVLGDPAQLPPIRGEGYFTQQEPDYMLTEIHRQAAESPIIRLATQTRKKETLDIGAYGNCRVVRRKNISANDVLKVDQLLVGRNATRFQSNKRIRGLMGLTDPLPVVNDRLVCLRNNNDLAILNGGIYTVETVGHKMDNKIILGIKPDYDPDGVAQELLSHQQHFLGEADKLQWFEKKDAEEFDYGYALTVHKSQGSQWDKVTIFDESSSFRNDWWRWLYTGITRAAEEVTVAVDD